MVRLVHYSDQTGPVSVNRHREKRLAMAFMERQITDKQTWVELDGSSGVTAVPYDLLSMSQVNAVTETKYDVSEATLNEELGDYYDGQIYNTNLREGYGARLSAPGYMDCTEWAVFDTEAEAESYLEEMYGDEDEDSD